MEKLDVLLSMGYEVTFFILRDGLYHITIKKWEHYESFISESLENAFDKAVTWSFLKNEVLG